MRHRLTHVKLVLQNRHGVLRLIEALLIAVHMVWLIISRYPKFDFLAELNNERLRTTAFGQSVKLKNPTLGNRPVPITTPRSSRRFCSSQVVSGTKAQE